MLFRSYYLSQIFAVFKSTVLYLSDAFRNENTFNGFLLVTLLTNYFRPVWYHQTIGVVEQFGLLLVCCLLLVSLLEYLLLTIKVCCLSFEALNSCVRVLRLCLASFQRLFHYRSLFFIFSQLALQLGNLFTLSVFQIGYLFLRLCQLSIQHCVLLSQLCDLCLLLLPRVV